MSDKKQHEQRQRQDEGVIGGGGNRFQITSKREKIENACYRLNAESWLVQAKSRRRVKRFSPCEKATVMMESLSMGNPLMVIEADALSTPCDCHHGLDEPAIFDMMFDSSWKAAHHAGYSAWAHKLKEAA